MERPEPLCTTLLFLFAFQVEYFFPNFSLFFFILSVRRSVSSAYVPRNATQLAMCLGSLCTESKDLWSAENFISGRYFIYDYYYVPKHSYYILLYIIIIITL